MTGDVDGDYETNRICPLCGQHAPGRRLEKRGLYEFQEHGSCGHFLVSYGNMARVALESDEQRARRRQQVAVENGKGIVPLVA